jgi:hypothetical protein
MSRRTLTRFGLAAVLIGLAYGGFNLVGAFADGGEGGYPQQPQTVIVGNKTTNPVPVTVQGAQTITLGNPTVTIGNATVPVHEQGTANVNVTNTSLPVTQAPVTNGGGQASIPADGTTHSLTNAVTASELSLYLPNTVFSLTLYDQGNPVAVFQGPSLGYAVDLLSPTSGPVFTNSIMNVPLIRPITFDSAQCSGGTQACVIGWVGNSP